MLKNLLVSLLVCFCFAKGWTQSTFDYANGWYDDNQSYAKILVAENGVYRVTASELSAVGFSVTSADITNMQLIYRGREQHLYVKTTSGNLDYIEFFGKRNDGKVDSIMYREPYSHVHHPDQQPSEYVSLFSDTSAYFLTIGPTAGLRYTDFTDTNYGVYVPEPYFRYGAFAEYHPDNVATSWNPGGGATYDIFHILNSYYITGEGYVGHAFSPGAPRFEPIPTPFAANVGNPNEFVCRIYGRSSYQHVLNVKVDGNLIINDSVTGIYIRTRSTQFNQLLNATTQVLYEALGQQNLYTDNNNLSYTTIVYDRFFDMGGQSSIAMVNWLKPTNAYFQFINTANSTSAVVYDLTTHRRCVGTGTGNTMRIVVPGSATPRQLFVVGDQAYKQAIIKNTSLANLKDVNAGATFVIITHPSLAASANAYKLYRDTCTLNPQTAKVVYVDQIYDEFGSGTVTPLAIKRFCKYAIDNWTEKPKYFLLWGKGQYQTRHHPFNLVPTYGYPADDYDFVSDFDNMSVNVEPEAAVGRVNVYNNSDGFIYLNKIMEYEHTPWTPWMKEAVFLGGGNDTTEQKPILDYLLRFMHWWELPPMGGHGNYYQKFYNGMITNSNMTSTQRINAGCNVINFFGHSSSNIYDVDIQEPSLYLNYGKYPMMLAFGCYGGNFCNDDKSFGERFVLLEGRGSIGYLANSTAGYLTPLGNFGERSYPVVCNSHFGEALGDQVRYALQSYGSTWTDQVYINHAKQLNLQGDPALHLYHPVKPDLEITSSSIFFEPANFSAADSFFTMNVIVHNHGLVTTDSFLLSIRQMTPQGGNWTVFPSKKFAPVVNTDTLEYVIFNKIGPQIAGLNQFDVFVDSTNLLDEYREDNNRVTHSVVIPGNVPAILYPYDYAVIDEQQTQLSASSLIMSQQATVRYVYEIDTTPTFTSPRYYGSGPVAGSAIYSAWNVPFTLVDSTVYYWRVRLADVYPISWAKASFKYIPQKRGWAQSRPPQFFDDGTYHVTMDRNIRQWGFDRWSVDLHAYSAAYAHAVFRLANGAFFSTLPDANNLNGLMYTPIRARDLQPAITHTIHGDWAYAAMPDGQNIVVNAIASLEKGDYFLAVSERDPNVQQWAPHVRSAFSMIGCDTSLLNNFTPGNALVILGKKDYPGQGIVLTSPNVFDVPNSTWQTDLRKSMQTNYSTGAVYSTTVGPASNWQNLIWDWNTMDPYLEENARVSVYVSRDGVNDSLYYVNLAAGNYALSTINARKYPFIKLKAELVDSAYLTAPQLEHWHVIYTPAPDAVIDPISVWSFDHDSLVQGGSVTVKYAARNITDANMDSLLVRYVVQLPDRRTIEVGRKRFGPLLAGQTMTHEYTFSTNYPGLVGNMSFTIELNPDNDQPEQYHFNNLFSRAFFVSPDEVNPLVDVTVDGKHLIDGDIVSPLPEILVQINDENRFLAVNDTAFEIHFGLKTPNPANLPRVFIAGNPQMTIEPANLPDNKAKLHFKPGHLVDGDYTLRVQGFDYAGNGGGKSAYEINFKVVNEIAMSNVLNYPNPFSTSTRFVYTLTGAETPEKFDIHIYTISGKLVKVIDLHETNDVKTGYTMTRYAWDGRDEFGDLLANGVYIYKVVAKLDGKELKLREEGISEMFDNGFGKMYIMR